MQSTKNSWQFYMNGMWFSGLKKRVRHIVFVYTAHSSFKIKLKIIQQNNLMSNKVLIIEELRLSSAIVLCECLPFNYYENKPNIPI
jgi:hypothetical protein